jgi:anthranilate/para-aminobenzoate synthase component II
MKNPHILLFVLPILGLCFGCFVLGYIYGSKRRVAMTPNDQSSATATTNAAKAGQNKKDENEK